MQVTERYTYESGRDYAYRMIRKNIINMELKPGTMVSEQELASQLELSRTPVREALIDLSKAGIIDVLPQRGSRIAYIDYTYIDEACVMRSALEQAACRLICALPKEDALRELWENVAAQEAAIAAGALQEFFLLDETFHQLLFRMANLPHAHTLIKTFTVHFDRVRNLALAVNEPAQLLKEHRALAQALADRDYAAACKGLEAHLSTYKMDRVQLKAQFPDYFAPEQR